MSVVTINNEQRLFVIQSNGGCSCLGFDVVFGYISELARRIAKAGKVLGASGPNVEELGTLKQYSDYQALMAQYRSIGDTETWFSTETAPEVRRVLERYRKSGSTIRIFYGDSATGRDWLEEFDMVGTIGRSMGPMRVPLLIAQGENGGGALLTGSIVRLVDVYSGKTVYVHPKYHQPKMMLRELTHETFSDAKGKTRKLTDMGYTHGVWVEGKDGKESNHANFKSLGKASHWLAFMAGESNDLRD